MQICGQKAQKSLQNTAFGLLPKLYSINVNDIVFHDYAKTACLDSNGLKSSQPFSIFVHQYIWKKSIDTLDIFHGEKKKQAGFETTTLGLVWSVVPFTQSDSRIP